MSATPSLLSGPAAPALRHATLLQALADAARSDSGLTFVDASSRDQFLPYAQLQERALRCAVSLAELGIGPGDVVAMVLPTAPSFMDAFFGVLLAGAVPAPLYPPVRLARMDEYHARTARMLELSGAKALITDARVGSLLGVAAARARVPLGVHRIADLVARGSGKLAERPREAGDLALIQFSSGTTVDPKPVALTHRNVLANAAAIDSFFPAEPTDPPQRGTSWLPLYHDMGLIGGLVVALAHPGPLTLIPPELFLARPALWLQTLSRHRASISPAPNFAFGLCLKRVRDEDLAGCDLSAWKFAFNGAEPISPEIARRFCERFSRYGFDPGALMPVYGLSEASLAVTFSPPGRGTRTVRLDAEALSTRGEAVRAEGGARELVSVGVPVQGVSVKVAGDDGGPVEEGRVGRVLVQGPSVMRGYLGNEEATARAIRDGWLDTGDLGLVLGGELYLVGRAKDVVIVRGRNHAPQEFEDALAGMAGVRAGCAVAVGFVPAQGEGEELLLLVELEAETPPTSELVEALRSRALDATGVRAHTVELLAPGTLPRTSSGKLRRGEALRLHQAGELVAPGKVTTLKVLTEVAKSKAALAGMRLRAAVRGTPREGEG
ncbi:MAG TPA: fatty acyl-AMP ligase [Myxococcales bacterium]